MTIYIQRFDGDVSFEGKLIIQYAVIEQLKTKCFSGEHAVAVPTVFEKPSLIVGSVEALSAYFSHNNIAIPEPHYYPVCLTPYLYRSIRKQTLNESLPRLPFFIKSHDYKVLTGCVMKNTEDLQALSVINNDNAVWIGDVVQFVSEYRVYVCHHEILAMVEYTEPHESLLPSDKDISDMVALMKKDLPEKDTYTLDVGVLLDGRTALVEVNDAWAIGAYHGITYRDYMTFLQRRWTQIHQQSLNA
jgi:hypothetical protein